jgi:predicted DNA-binding protein with PD1-like motif
VSKNIHIIRPKPNADLVETLKSLLEDAKVGDLVSIAFTGHQRDYAVRYGYCKPDNMKHTTMTGAVSFLHYKMNQIMDESG